MNKIKAAKKVILKDYSQYEYGKSSNGGCYAFFKEFNRIDNTDNWEVEYSTSADFPYCPYGAGFQNCDCSCVYDQIGQCSPDIVRTEDVIREIAEWENLDDEDYTVEYKY